MKRCLLLILAVLLMLAGCTEGKPEQTQPPATTPPAETQVPTTAPSLADPGDPLTAGTDGAIAAFRLEDGECDLAFMGSKPLLFYNDGINPTRLCRLETENYSVEASVELAGILYPGAAGFRATGGNLGYYVESENAVIILDAMLREVSRAVMPEDMEALPLIGADMRTVWYAAGTELRVMDLETGISRPLRQRDCAWISLQEILFDDRVLLCGIGFGDGSYTTEFISTETGETLGSDTGFCRMDAWGDSYFLERTEGVIQEFLFGTEGGAVRTLVPREDSLELNCVLELKGVVGSSWDEISGSSFCLYDLESGKVLSSVPVPGLQYIRSITGDPSGRYIWFLGAGESGRWSLYRWDTEATPEAEETVYTMARYTREDPDMDGLAQCRARADALEAAYGISLHMQEDVPPVEDYVFDFEFHPRSYAVALDQLEEVLSQFPEDFFRKLGSVSADGKVHIGLVRDLEGRTTNSIPDATGVQYWYEGNACLTLKVSTYLSGAFYHELAHVMDTFILNETLEYDDWEALNPQGFRYDWNYSDYLTREDLSLAEGENRAFLNNYSMTYPKEDRAELFAAAMDPYAADYFSAPILQEKLTRICKGIRDAFGLKKDERTFPWEQYLEKSLAYVKK